MTDLDGLMKQVLAFRNARDWAQFHNPKDLAISLALEAHEFLEIFQWKNGPEVEAVSVDRKKDLAEELADVFCYTLLASHALGIDLKAALLNKLAKNELNYPVEKSRGSNRKYTEL